MKKLKTVLLFILIISSLSSCDFIKNSITYKSTTEAFVENLIQENYDESLNYMALDHKGFKLINRDTLKRDLKNLKQVIVNNFGEELNYRFVTAEKTFSTTENEGTAPNTTKAQIQFSNEEYFGVFELIFDDNSNKILNIETLNIKEPIPNMLFFWLFSIFPISILLFNIFIIRLIKKSELPKKWLKYISVLIFNVPTISYNAVSGLSISLFSFQVLFGFSFSYMGYLGSIWAFGIPLGGLFWLWKLNRKKPVEISDENITE